MQLDRIERHVNISAVQFHNSISIDTKLHDLPSHNVTMFQSRVCLFLFQRPFQRHTFSATPSSGHAPLNILFCGSDTFSLESLRTLLQLKSTGVVQQLDVLTKLEKGSGRGKKESRLSKAYTPPLHLTIQWLIWTVVPTKEFATEKGLRTCQITSFEDWKAGVTNGVPRGWEVWNYVF